MVRKRTPTELEKAEVKLRTILDKRDELNEQANLVRQERDLLHQQRKDVAENMRQIKAKRDELVKEMRVHKLARNRLHNEARDLIDAKRSMRGKVTVGLGDDLKRLRKEVDKMVMRQQTETLTIADENDLIDEMRGKYKELLELEKIEDENVKTTKDVAQINRDIDDIFRQADKEHKLVVQLSEEAQKLHDQVTEAFKTIAALTAEANKKHEEYIELRQKADDCHQRAQDMRKTVLKTREDERREKREARDLIRKQNLAVRKALTDEKKLEEAAEETLQALLKHGKVEIKG